MNEQPSAIWFSAYPLWLRYSELRDEYFSLKSKWNYIQAIAGLSALPDFKENFKRIDRFIDETDKQFRISESSPVFDRRNIDRIDRFNEKKVQIV